LFEKTPLKRGAFHFRADVYLVYNDDMSRATSTFAVREMSLQEAINKWGQKKGLYLLFYQNPDTGECFYKLGYSKDITSRFQQYPLTVRVLHFFVGENYFDRPCQTQLRKWGFKFRTNVVNLNDTEWMEALNGIRNDEEHLKWSQEAINVVFHEKEDYRLLHLETYKPDSLQQPIIDETFRDLMSQRINPRYLIHAETGSGKTLMGYKIALKIVKSLPDKKATIIVILTWKPKVLIDWESYVNGNENGKLPHKDLRGAFKFTTDAEQAKKWIKDPEDDRAIVIGLSAFKLMVDAKKEDADEEDPKSYQKKWNFIYNYRIALLITDEVHYGASGKAFFHLTAEEEEDNYESKFDGQFQFDKLLALSATPFPNLRYSDFYHGHLSKLTSDEQVALREAVRSGKNIEERDQRYKDYPDVDYAIIQCDLEVQENAISSGRDIFSIDYLFIDPTLKPYANQSLRKLRTATMKGEDPGDDLEGPPFTFLEKYDHVIVRTRRRIAAQNAIQLFDNDSSYDEYIKIDGPGSGYDKTKLDKILNENSNVMFGTAGGLMTGCDMPSMNKLINLGTIKSSVTLAQDVGRIRRIYPGKDRALVVFLSPDVETTLVDIAKSWCIIRKEGESEEDAVKRNPSFDKVALYNIDSFRMANWNDFNSALNKAYLREAESGRISSQLFTEEGLHFLIQNVFINLKIDKKGKIVLVKSKYKRGQSTTRVITDSSRDKNKNGTKEVDYTKLLSAIASNFILILKSDRNGSAREIIERNVEVLAEFCNTNLETIHLLFANGVNWSAVQKLMDSGAIDLLPDNYEGSFQTVPESLADKMEKECYKNASINKTWKESTSIPGGGKYLVDRALKHCEHVTYAAHSQEERFFMQGQYKSVENSNGERRVRVVMWKDFEKETEMGDKYCILNPPYGRMHLRILKKMIELIVNKNNGKVVSLQPVRWLQDPLIDSKEDSVEMRSFLEGKTTIEIITKNEAARIFNIPIAMDIGIYKIGPKTKISLDTVRQPVIARHLLKKDNLKNSGLIKTTVGKSKTGNFVLLLMIGASGGHRKESHVSSIVRESYGVFVNFKNEHGRTVLEQKKTDPKSTNGNPENWPCIEFETGEEAINFWKYCHLADMRYFARMSSNDVNVQTNYLPFPRERDAFKNEWTEGHFHKYWKIEKEKKEIEKIMREIDAN
jgi:superfamily II DNA or RNA helicase